MSTSARFTRKDCEIVKRESLYEGIFRLYRYHLRHRLFKGGWSDVFQREMVERSSAAAVLPYDPELDRVILIEQFRIGALQRVESPWLIEIPAGLLEKGKTPEETAHQEVQQEAGCDIVELYPICDYLVSPGGADEQLHLYCGKVDAKQIEGIYGLEDEHEDIRVINVSFAEAMNQWQQGKIKTAPAIIALLWLQLNRDLLQAKWK